MSLYVEVAVLVRTSTGKSFWSRAPLISKTLHKESANLPRVPNRCDSISSESLSTKDHVNPSCRAFLPFFKMSYLPTFCHHTCLVLFRQIDVTQHHIRCWRLGPKSLIARHTSRIQREQIRNLMVARTIDFDHHSLEFFHMFFYGCNGPSRNSQAFECTSTSQIFFDGLAVEFFWVLLSQC